MSRSYRSYDEDWQRRKSILIRSLFHDIPILSPVPEESLESPQHVPITDVFDDPIRPYSPLPPLIIEVEPKKPDKHDEPEEYYRKLHNKIKKIYIKLFIENRDLSSEDYSLTYNNSFVNDDNLNDSDGVIDDNLDLIPENNIPDQTDIDSVNDERDSFVSINSNGYSADFESMDTETIDVINYTATNEDVVMIYEKEKSSNENVDEHDIIEMEESDTSTTDNEETIGTGESNSNDDENFVEPEKIFEAKASDEVPNETEESSDLRIDNQEFIEVEKTYEQRKKNFEEINIDRNRNQKQSTEEDSNNSTELIESDELNDNSDDNQETNKTTSTDIVSQADFDSIVKEKELKLNKNEGTVTADRKELIISNNEAMEEDFDINSSGEGSDFRQITTEAIVHVDGTQEDIESRVYEDSIRSIVLPTRPFRKFTGARDIDDRIEELSPLEDNEDPKSISTIITDESETSEEDIEEMRTPRLNLTEGTIPVTHGSDSGTPSDHIAPPPKPTALTSSSQDGVNENMSELKTSDDMIDILTSILNESRNKETVSLGRKRRLCEDVSVQTSERISWDDICGNFFVKTPKIFRLCSCTDHICQ